MAAESGNVPIILGMSRVGAPISLAGSQLGEARHVCAFFKNREDEYNVTLPFIKEGLEAGDKAIHIIDPARRADHLKRMASFGIDTVPAQQSGQFELHDWQSTFFFRWPLQSGSTARAPRRCPAEGATAGVSLHSVRRPRRMGIGRASLNVLLEFEARVNHIWPRSADTVICTYDLARYGADTVIDVFRTHPMIIIGGVLQQNPFFVQPDDFLSELRKRQLGGASHH